MHLIHIFIANKNCGIQTFLSSLHDILDVFQGDGTALYLATILFLFRLIQQHVNRCACDHQRQLLRNLDFCLQLFQLLLIARILLF
jgi:hypothetical protein